MTRTRRISIEVVRRELRLSVTRRPAGEVRPDPAAREEAEVAASAPPPGECPDCASPWFLLPAGGGEEPAMVQRALRQHGIHTLLLPTGELLICGRSFELHTGAFDVPNAATTEQRGHEDLPPGNSAGED